MTDVAIERRADAAAAGETIAVGCFASLCRDRLADHLVAFAAAWPDVGIGVHEMAHAELLPALAAGRLTVAIRAGEPEPGFAGCEMWTDRAMVAMHAGHRLTAAEEVAAAALAGEVLLLSRDRANGAIHRFLAARLFDGTGPATRLVPDARRRELLTRVARGEGLALLCASQVDASVAHLAVRPVAGPAAHFAMRAWWRDCPLSAPAQGLVALLCGSAPG